MMNKQAFNLIGAQQQRILEIVWQRGSATVHDVLAEMNADPDSPPLAYTTILTTMQKLEKAGWLKHESEKKDNRMYIYRVTQSRNSAIGSALRKFADTFLDGSKTLLFQHLVNDAGLSDQELDEIRTIIKNAAENNTASKNNTVKNNTNKRR